MTDDEQLLRDEKKLIEEDEGRLRRYLLGLSSPEESAEIERAILVDDTGSILNVIEDELIEDYVTDELNKSDRSRFEKRFLFNQETVEKIRVAAMLIGRPGVVEGLGQRIGSLRQESRVAELVSSAKTPDNAITALLAQLSEGNRAVETQLIPKIYGELRRLAGRYMQSERGDHTLQPTDLVHEAYARLVMQPQVPWQSQAHFFATASRLMRQILVDHARARKASKRGGVQHQVTLAQEILPSTDRSIDILALHEVLERLEKLNTRQARIVELHFFGGLSFEEIGLVVHVSERTVRRDWSMARAWLQRELSK